MKNPRIYKFDCTSWYWNACKIELKLKTKETVILAKTIVTKASDGKIEEWKIKDSDSKGPLYIVAEDTTKDDDKVLCLAYGYVQQDAIVLPNDVKWDTTKQNGNEDYKGVSVFDSMILRSQIKLI